MKRKLLRFLLLVALIIGVQIMRVDFADIKPSLLNFVLFFFMAVVTIPAGKFALAYLASVLPVTKGLSDLANSI